MAMVQDPASARYDGIPRSAIAIGMVDYVLPPEKMPEDLLAYVRRAFALGIGKTAPTIPAPKTADHLRKIFILLRAHTGHDFFEYKPNTIQRRVERRMVVNQIERLPDYVRFLQQSPIETETLFKEPLIGVTYFFRDPDAFEELRKKVLPVFHYALNPGGLPLSGHNRDGRRVAELEQELRSTKEYLQTTLEELETSHEELTSTNEELQSANEELETSKEELQSVNEELVTVNTELETKIEQLAKTSNDLSNLLVSTDIGTLFLDTDLRVRTFTHLVAQIFNLVQTDQDRPNTHFVSNLKYSDWKNSVQEVVRTLEPISSEAQTEDGHWYAMRIRPYRTTENVIEGVVITFADIDP